MNLDQIIKLRRNVKPSFFTGEVIPDSEVLELLISANWAPTHAYTEPWRFVVFSGNALNDFAKFQSTLYKDSTPEHAFKELKYQKLKSNPLLASHIIAVVVHLTEKSTIPILEEIVATSCSVQNILLAAACNKIAVHWTSGGMTYTPEMKSFLGFEPNDLVLGFLYLGKAPEKINKEGKRLSSISNKVTWNK